MPDGAPLGIYLPADNKALLSRAMELIQACQSSQGIRAAYARQIYSITETGRQDGTRSKINKLYSHIDRLASHLYSPTELRFTLDFENHYPKNILERASSVARVITNSWKRSNLDMTFALGVFEALRYGSCFLKQWAQMEGSGENEHPVYHHSLVMPWMFGVTNEKNHTLDKQDAMCETIILTLPEVWKRIYHLPDAQKLFARIRANARKGMAGDEDNSFFHQVLSTSTLSTGIQGMTRPVSGGIVQLNNYPNYAVMGPQVDVEVVRMNELWVRDRDDYKTIQIIEPDVMIAPSPYLRVSNLLISGATNSCLHPYSKIQPNEVFGYLFGRSEVVDLIEPQGLVSTWADDISRILGVQFDRILAFDGDGLTDEQYDQGRAAGYFNIGVNGKVQDLTPQMPPDAIGLLGFALQQIDALGGFDNILNGQGQPGMRSAEQGELQKQMSSPRLRDRSLLVERQCAQSADLTLSMKEAKEKNRYWTDGSTMETIKETAFHLTDLPQDWSVSVDSHSGSPVFRTEHEQRAAFGFKSGLVDGVSALEMLDLPNRDIIIQRYKEKQEQEQKMIAELVKRDPEALTKILSHKGGGHH